MINVSVNASKDYNVLINSGSLSKSGDNIMAVCGGKTAMIITDDIVDGLYGETIEKSLKTAGYIVHKYVFENGEASKTLEIYTSILINLTEAGLTRSDVVVALGGGVTGDMAGFAAATYLRGVRFVQIPTTLLAMVDSSVGGKTAVNLPSGKNRAGTFYQPDLVLCDVETLNTLPGEEFRNGCAEMVKHGVIRCSELFELLTKPLEPQLEDIIARNIIIKRDIVTKDEKDLGLRQLLNFGHTIGHGIEKHSNYSVTHGNAVAIGMAVSCKAAAHMGICDKNSYLRIVDLLIHFGLPYTTDISAELLIKAAYFDKKRSGQYITEVLPEKIGKCELKRFNMNQLNDFIYLGLQK